VKYCGGCNPRYDRRAAAERVRAAFPHLEWTTKDEGASDHVIVFCGCPVACADHKALRGDLGKIVVSSPEDSARLEETLRPLYARQT
jgi:4-hydroxybutyrate CoA-transferase